MNEFIQIAVAGGILYALYQVYVNANRMRTRKKIVRDTPETVLPADHQKALLKVLVDAELDEEQAVGTLLVLAARIASTVDAEEVKIVSETHDINFKLERHTNEEDAYD